MTLGGLAFDHLAVKDVQLITMLVALFAVRTMYRGNSCLLVKIELVEDGVGADDPTHLETLGKSLATQSEQMTALVSSDVTGQGARMSASDLAALVRGVSGLAAARSRFTATPCTYDELHVRFTS